MERGGNRKLSINSVSTVKTKHQKTTKEKNMVTNGYIELDWAYLLMLILFQMPWNKLTVRKKTKTLPVIYILQYLKYLKRAKKKEERNVTKIGFILDLSIDKTSVLIY